ncbi:uncharacterized protein LOC122250638 [Penaeus japonicus]|uniref:uncharacterized protein LOC122250638 n=1 Tax=Penaeus japonicus TaxID=27405 RepID=UPI001C70B1F2|nr:uncharacterized protein LOC122250638 [Penaeus japonicus]XP_042868061.1 uncharacterized protein LOC122250638 [Penaeus japonicus]
MSGNRTTTAYAAASAAASAGGMMSAAESLSIASALSFVMLIAAPLNFYVSRALHQMPPAVKRSLIDYVMMYSSTAAAVYAVTVLPVRIANILAFVIHDALGLSRRIPGADFRSRLYDATLNGTLDLEGVGRNAQGRLDVTGAGPYGGAATSATSGSAASKPLAVRDEGEAAQKNATPAFGLDSRSEDALQFEIFLSEPESANASSSAQPPFLDGLCWSNYLGDSFFMAVLSNLMIVTPVIRFMYVFFPVFMLSISVRASSRRLLVLIVLAAVGYTAAAARNPTNELIACVNRGIESRAGEENVFFSHIVGVLGATGLNIGLNVFAYSAIAIYLTCCRRKPGHRSILVPPRQSFHVVPLVVNLAHTCLYIITSSVGITFAFFLHQPQTESLYLHLSHILVLAFFMLLSPCALLFGCQKIRCRFLRDVNSCALSRFSSIPPWTTGRNNAVSVALVAMPRPDLSSGENSREVAGQSLPKT